MPPVAAREDGRIGSGSNSADAERAYLPSPARSASLAPSTVNP
jgi:hypothetical protein